MISNISVTSPLELGQKTREEKLMAGFIERNQWKTFLDEFSKRNQLRPSRIEVIGEIGDQEEEKYLPFIGVNLETKGSAAGSVEIILGGETAGEPRQLNHLIEHVERIAPLLGTTTIEEGLGIEDKEGNKTLLHFEMLPEIPSSTSADVA